MPSLPCPVHGMFVVSLAQTVAEAMASRKLTGASARILVAERLEDNFTRDYHGGVHGMDVVRHEFIG